jgi:hypothetical protein
MSFLFFCSVEIVDRKFYEIKSSFAECDAAGSVSEADFVRLLRLHCLLLGGGTHTHTHTSSQPRFASVRTNLQSTTSSCSQVLSLFALLVQKQKFRQTELFAAGFALGSEVQLETRETRPSRQKSTAV